MSDPASGNKSLIDELMRPSVRMKDPSAVEDKVCQLMKGGHQHLQVIADFDMTLSRSHYQGKPCSSCHGAIDGSHRLPRFYQQKAKEYKDYYYPIEIDPKMTPEEKIPLMVEWWTKAEEVLLQTKLNCKDLPAIVEESEVMLRDECVTFFELLHQEQVPLVIISAGLGNILEEVIRQQAHLYDNVKIISNYFKFDENGQLCGFSNALIHTYNKNTSAVSFDTAYRETVANRGNVILMGDSMGDVNMDAGVPNVQTILRIGFLNDKIEANLPWYLDNYDVVLLNDQSMDLVNAILRKIM